MKTSISIPDELWDCVKGTADGPSAVVQEALGLLCKQQQRPLANAPTNSARDRFEAPITEQAERLAAESLQVQEQGYELGVALASHLTVGELAVLPGTPEQVAADLGRPIPLGLWGQVSPDNDWHEWQNSILLEADIEGALSENFEFWSHLWAALERHFIAPESDRVEIDDGTVYFYNNRNAGDMWSWQLTHPDPGWWLPEGSPGIGYELWAEDGIPEPYLLGIASALVDLRTAVHNRLSATTTQNDDPGEGQS